MVTGAITGAFVQLGYEKPTASQEEAILEFVKGRDVFVSLPTGDKRTLDSPQALVRSWTECSSSPRSSCQLVFMISIQLRSCIVVSRYVAMLVGR